MSLVMLQSLLPQLILALGATVVLMLGAWFRNRQLWLNVGALICFSAALTAVFTTAPLTEVAGMFSTALYARFLLCSGR